MAEPARVLMVCTGNICRSPAMHYLAQEWWGEAAEVYSAGTSAEVGMDATWQMRAAAHAHGIDIPKHRATQLTAAQIEDADLVLVATETHGRWIAQEIGEWPDHVFGLKQAAELAGRAPAPAGDTPAERLASMAKTLRDQLRLDPVSLHSLDDPWAQNQETHERIMGEIVAAIETLTDWAALR